MFGQRIDERDAQQRVTYFSISDARARIWATGGRLASVVRPPTPADPPSLPATHLSLSQLTMAPVKHGVGKTGVSGTKKKRGGETGEFNLKRVKGASFSYLSCQPASLRNLC